MCPQFYSTRVERHVTEKHIICCPRDNIIKNCLDHSIADVGGEFSIFKGCFYHARKLQISVMIMPSEKGLETDYSPSFEVDFRLIEGANEISIQGIFSQAEHR